MAARSAPPARVAIDIGGTFTDVVLDTGDERFATKVPTTHADPAEAVLDGLERVMRIGRRAPGDVSLILHGTTLATNALIERSGAVTALVTTQGHRDALEMAHENRFEQYDIDIDRPRPLVPRRLRLTVPERMNAAGEVLLPLDEDAVHALVPVLTEQGVTSIAVGLLHAYANSAHERRIGALLAESLPDVSITLASEVCPEIREFERLSTACANAYVRPLMARYLTNLSDALAERGFGCPFLMMTSGGGLTDVDTAARFPIRLVESGPAGGAILASRLAEALDLDRVLSFDMGGTTAKICLIDDHAPLLSRAFEVDRAYRFKKGSGLPVRIPVIEMVEIGAGGGSIAAVDKLDRIQVGPASAGSEPGPACYGRGGTRATVTDADTVMGRLDAERFAGGTMRLQEAAAARAVDADVGRVLGMDTATAAFGVCEVVDENMAAAARAHAAEWGKSLADRTLIAYGGAAPLHAVRLADKLGLDRIVVPAGAGVGAAVGFLAAPVSYEVARSRYLRLSDFDAGLIDTVMAEMRREAREIVEAASDAPLVETRRAYMRYAGQGYEIAVELPAGAADQYGREALHDAFEAAYGALYGRVIPDLDIEVLSWTLTLGAEPAALSATALANEGTAADGAPAPTELYDPGAGERLRALRCARESLGPGAAVEGPALIVEAQTTTVLSPAFHARVTPRGDIVMQRIETGTER
ncbi:MAG: hydantoinase/oxoprolinase family protein [Gammaproteobacteria bacterium]|nr:hydantoinase/oxoprolinase family protein [Gammaproteobacteria bacterium]